MPVRSEEIRPQAVRFQLSEYLAPTPQEGRDIRSREESPFKYGSYIARSSFNFRSPNSVHLDVPHSMSKAPTSSGKISRRKPVNHRRNRTNPQHLRQIHNRVP